MLSCLDTDLDVIFASSDFGEAEGIVYNGDTENPIQGIFDDDDVETQNGEGVVVITPQTMITVASSDVPDLQKGSLFVVRSVNYETQFWVTESGVTEIFLERVDASEILSSSSIDAGDEDDEGDLIIDAGDHDDTPEELVDGGGV